MKNSLKKPVISSDVDKLFHELETQKIELEMQNEEIRVANAELKESLEKYAELYDFSPAGLLTLSPRGRIIECNLAAAELIGIPRASLINRDFNDLTNKIHSSSTFKKFLDRVIASSTKQTVEVVIQTSSNTLMYCQLIGLSIVNEEQEKQCRVALIDFTAQKQRQAEIQALNEELQNSNQEIGLLNIELEKRLKEIQFTNDTLKNSRLAALNVMEDAILARDALRQSEERYALAEKASNIGSWDWNIGTGELKWSETIEPMFGFQRGQFKKTYDAFLDCVHPADRQLVIDSMHDCIEKGKSYDIDHRIIWPDASIHWVHEVGNTIKETHGKAKRMLGVVQDITKRKQADLEIFRLTSFPENNPNPIVELDLTGSLRYINPIAHCLFPDINSAGLKHPFLKEITPQVLQNLRKNPDKTISCEAHVPPGCYLQTLSYIPENQTVHVYSMDITKLKETEETLKESEEKYRMIVENTTNMIMVTQPDGIISYLSPSCKNILGYSEDELVGTNLNIIHPDDNELVQKALSRALNGEKGSNLEYRILTKQGLTKWVAHSWSPIIQNKKLRCVVSVVDDITARREIEEKIQRLNENLLRHSIELSTINKELEAFSYSVSHDLRAPLRSIDGFSQALLEDYASKLDDQGKDYLQRVRTAAQHMGQLINDMLRLSRLSRSELTMETVDLSFVAHQLVEKYLKENPSRKISINIKEGITVTGDKKLLEILLDNLLGNAWKFTGKTKRPVIELGETMKDNERSFFIRDNGAGFDMAYADKLFVPFQRLHSPDEFYGSGIGLAIVSRIVHRHGGRIWAEAKVGKGATFYFTLQPKEGTIG